jgi:hypothetical protein
MKRLAIAVVTCASWAGTLAAQPTGTAFTYQGRLTDGGNPASGSYDLRLTLFDAAAGGGTVGPVLTRDDVAVSSGLFTVSLDFGAVFTGSKRWIEVAVRPGASTGAYTPLTPRQELSPAPNATFSLTTPWAGIANKPPGFADDVDNDSGGDVTGVTAGVGLTGGGAAGAVTLGVAFGSATGTADTVARGDHVHTNEWWTADASTQPVLRIVNSGDSGFTDGIWGQADTPTTGRGVVGYASATSGTTFGVWGQADSSTGRGVFGLAATPSGSGIGVLGQTNAPFGYGVRGVSSGVAVGVTGVSDNNLGVWGQTQGSGSGGTGVLGTSFSTSGSGVRGRVQNGAGSGTTYAIYGEAPASPNGYAGYFAGRLHVTGTLSKGAGSFKIDHPLDPANKYLYHSFVESPDMMNVYNGNIVTDADGYATVTLPEWFEALNRDFRYQLTVIGRFAQAIVAKEVEDNRFVIQTSTPGVKVSWQVTGIRRDPFAEANRIPVEQDKPPSERGTYLHPRAWGRAEADGLDHGRWPDLPPDTP